MCSLLSQPGYDGTQRLTHIETHRNIHQTVKRNFHPWLPVCVNISLQTCVKDIIFIFNYIITFVPQKAWFDILARFKGSPLVHIESWHPISLLPTGSSLPRGLMVPISVTPSPPSRCVVCIPLLHVWAAPGVKRWENTILYCIYSPPLVYGLGSWVYIL